MLDPLCSVAVVVHSLALLSECGLISATMVITANSGNATVSTFFFLCGSLAITLFCFVLSFVGLAKFLRLSMHMTRRMAESVRGAARTSAGSAAAARLEQGTGGERRTGGTVARASNAIVPIA